MMFSLLLKEMGVQNWTYLLVGITFTIYIGIAIWTRASSTKEFYVAGGGVSPLANEAKAFLLFRKQVTPFQAAFFHKLHGLLYEHSTRVF